MAQASAFATRETCAVRHGETPVVQTLLRRLPYSNCTPYASGTLSDVVMSSLLATLSHRGGDLSRDVVEGLSDLVSTMTAMAEGTAGTNFFLSSLDPGVGKTTSLIHFVQALLGSTGHQDVAVLVCLSRRDEIERLVGELGLDGQDFAVLTADDATNSLSPTPTDQARILLTTHEMVSRRCAGGGRFSDIKAFQYQGEVRAVRIWDEGILPGKVISISTDELAALREPLRTPHPTLAALVDTLERDIQAADQCLPFPWPSVEAISGVSLGAARKGLEQKHVDYLDALYALSDRQILLRKHYPGSTVISALDTRDVLPDDLAPMVVLDASGRVRSTYAQWEKTKGNLVRLRAVPRSYGNLTIRIMEKGAGRSSWNKNGAALAQEVAHVIDTKPGEPWLVLYHKGAIGGTVPDQIRGFVSTDPDRVRFLNWGKHQGTNDFRAIPNVILAGTQFYADSEYEMMTRHCSSIVNDVEVPKTLLDQMRDGEHMHHILQALCRSAVRKGMGAECGHCNAYIIAAKASGIRKLLPKTFPGCKIGTWTPTAKKKPSGKVGEAVGHVEKFFEDDPKGTFLLRDLRDLLGNTDPTNFKNKIRTHPSFKEALAELGLEEVATGSSWHRNALAKQCVFPCDDEGEDDEVTGWDL